MLDGERVCEYTFAGMPDAALVQRERAWYEQQDRAQVARAAAGT